MPCLICRHKALIPLEGFAELPRVSSDSRPMSPGGRLVKCSSCSAVQKPVDLNFRTECEKIYTDYLMYPQSSQGQEPSVFDGKLCERSTRLISVVTKEINLPETGYILDVGCGNGNLLRAFSFIRPEWKLSGLELNGRNRLIVEAVCGKGMLHTGRLADVRDKFDLITAIHVLEHLDDPLSFLQQTRERLAPGGHVLIQIPLWQHNPFDLVVADHCMHYDQVSLVKLLKQAGLKPAFTSEKSIPRELTMVARTGIEYRNEEEKKSAGHWPEAALKWLAEVSNLAATEQSKAGPKRFGIFGTGNAAMWLTNVLAGVNFYVDEDPTRQGINVLTGKQVYAPETVPEGSTVFICLPPELSESIKKRLGNLPINWLTTPPLEN